MADFFARSGFEVHVCIPKRRVQDRPAPDLHPSIILHRFFSPMQYYDHARAGDLPLFHEIARRIVAKLKSFDRKVLGRVNPRRNRFLERFCTRLIEEQGIGVLLTSSPPLYAGLIVRQVRRRLELRRRKKPLWIYDFRDLSWMHPTSRNKKVKGLESQRDFEIAAAGFADACAVVSTGMKRAVYQDGLNLSEERCLIVENGFAETAELPPQREAAEFVDRARSEGRIVLIYAGTGSLAERRNRYKGNKTLNCFVDPLLEDPSLGSKFALIMQGVINNGREFFEGVHGELEYLLLPAADNRQMRANLRLADVGISVDVDRVYSPLIMGGKLYDYISCGLALLLMYPDNAYSLQEFARQNKNKPYFADVFDDGSVKSVLREIAGDPRRLEERKFTAAEAEPYRRDNQYMKFIQLIEEWNR
jgi:hypothetical protein